MTALMTALPFNMQIKQQFVLIIVEWIFICRQFWAVGFVVVVIDEVTVVVRFNGVRLVVVMMMMM